MAYNSLDQLVKRLGWKADVPRLHPHLLRHSFSSSVIDLDPLRSCITTLNLNSGANCRNFLLIKTPTWTQYSILATCFSMCPVLGVHYRESAGRLIPRLVGPLWPLPSIHLPRSGMILLP